MLREASGVARPRYHRTVTEPIEPAEPSGPIESNVSLLDAARIMARGGDLDAKLGALVVQARNVSGGRRVTIHLVDDEGLRLIPVASDPSPAAREDTQDSEPIVIDGAPAGIVSALAERRAHLVSTDASGSVTAVPLVTVHDTGDTEVEGLMLWVSNEQQDQIPEAVLALADLAAVAIHQARLENAFQERADWTDRVANTDPLTGLANRPTFDRMLQLEILRATRQQTSLSIAVFAVNGLDRLNESSGAAVADDLLRGVASTLAGQLRLIDTVARFGPDSFAAICPGSGGSEAALRVRDAVARLPAPLGGDGTTGLVCGVARFPDAGADADALIAKAGEALSRARDQGPGSIVEAAQA